MTTRHSESLGSFFIAPLRLRKLIGSFRRLVSWSNRARRRAPIVYMKRAEYISGMLMGANEACWRFEISEIGRGLRRSKRDLEL